MELHITAKGLELDDTLRGRVQKLVDGVGRARAGAKVANVVLERTPTTCAVAAVFGFGEDQESLATHGEAPDFDRAFLEIERRLEKELKPA
jgi:hypothetical protein